MYYLRTRSAAPPIQFTVDQKVVQQVKEEKEQMKMSKMANGDQQEEGEEEAMMMQEGQTEGAVPIVQGKIDTESPAYKEALLACSRSNREACTMCSA